MLVGVWTIKKATNILGWEASQSVGGQTGFCRMDWNDCISKKGADKPTERIRMVESI